MNAFVYHRTIDSFDFEEFKDHGKDLEMWWEDRFGHAFDCLTQSEARYLTNTSDADTIRDRITAQEQT